MEILIKIDVRDWRNFDTDPDQRRLLMNSIARVVASRAEDKAEEKGIVIRADFEVKD